MLPGERDVAGVCPNRLLEGLKAGARWLNRELEEGAVLAGRVNRFVPDCELFVDWPNNDVCDLGSSDFCPAKPNVLPG